MDINLIPDTPDVEYIPEESIIIGTNYIPNPNSEDVIPITKSGAFINFNDLNNDMTMIKRVENYFTIKTMQLFGSYKQSKRCKVDKVKKRIIIPRFGIFDIISHTKKFPSMSTYTTISQIKPGNDPDKPFEWKIDFYNNNQRIITEHILKHNYSKERLHKGSAGLILNLEAGQGKSYIAAYLISKIQKKTAIILHSTSLIEQWKKVLTTCFGSDISIGEYYSKKKVDGDIVIFIIDSAMSGTFKVGNTELSALEYYNRFGFIVFDECHMYANNYAGRIFKIAQAPYMLGLSATPDENANGFDPLVWWEIGPVLVAKNIPGYENINNNFKGRVHHIMYYGPSEYTRLLKNETTDIVNIAGTINMVCNDPYRDNLVVDCIMDAIQAKHSIFVFADRREYLEKLRLLLHQKSIESDIMVDENDYMRIVGGIKPDHLEKAEQKASVIFSTYQYLSTGKSIPRMTALILATPRKAKIKQFIGRIFRLGSDENIQRDIYDITDMKVVLKGQYSARKKYYMAMGYTIIDYKEHYEKYKLTSTPASTLTSTLTSTPASSSTSIDRPIPIIKKTTDSTKIIKKSIQEKSIQNLISKFKNEK